MGKPGFFLERTNNQGAPAMHVIQRDPSWPYLSRLQSVHVSRVLCSDPTGSGRTEGGTKRRVRRVAIDYPHQNVCRRKRVQEQRRQETAGAEPEDLSVPKNLRQRRGKSK